MSDRGFDTFTRQGAVAVSRRRSLLTLGGAALAGSRVDARDHREQQDQEEARKHTPIKHALRSQ